MSENNYSSNREPNRPASATGFDGYYTNGSPAGKPGEFKVNIGNRDSRPARPNPAAPRTTPYSAPVAGRRVVPQPQPPRRTAANQSDASQPGRPAAPQQRTAPQKPGKPKKRKKVMTKAQKERRKYRRIRGGLIFLTVVICIAILSAIASAIALSAINDILAINKSGNDTVTVEIPAGSDFEKVYDILCDNGLVKQKLLCKFFLKFRHYDGYYSKKLGRYVDIVYEPGVYYFESDDGLEDMMEAIKESHSVSKDTIRLNFPEGWTIAKIFARLEKNGVCTAEKLYANLQIVGQQYDFYKNITPPSGRYLVAEGYLFPDTYDFYIGESASSVLKKMFENYQSKWTKEYALRAKQLGMTMDEVITLASIIQREAKDNTQMKDISSVLHNRLNDPATYPLLQMNSTKDYITAVNEVVEFNTVDYQLYSEAYNTYSVPGLPPGPICSPGLDAIDAALNPNETDYYYFCHDEDGNVYYAKTYEEHLVNMEKAIMD
ncbi:MAG: endolytic transglycosylase MltG [Clostridia bacterium]|nr:endolytic transglycosylase MltG [Clostridia bacterium]